MIRSLPSITKAAEAIRGRSLTPTDLIEFCLDRIRRFESRVRAWVLVDEQGARQQAARLTDEAARGVLAGPLHGIPIGIKDIVDVAGWPTKCGSPLREQHVARSDAEVVARLRRAGAIILGKTVTTEFASFDPPPTRNPWNLERTPGGSSSGSAAAVALEMCLAAIGTQTGGSIIRPASYCGVVGFKPTYGTVSLDGIEPLAWHLDHPGPITRSVGDAGVMLEVMSAGLAKPVTTADRPSLIRLSGFFEKHSDPDAKLAFEEAIRQLETAGVPVETRLDQPIDFARMSRSHRRIMSVETTEHHRQAFAESREQFGPRIRELIEEGLQTTAVDYAEALRHHSRVRAELAPIFEQRRILLLPSTTTPAPSHETTGDPAFNSLWSFAGLPELTIPCGLSSAGLPCGIQFVGPAGSESRVFAAAAVGEEILNFRERPRMLN